MKVCSKCKQEKEFTQFYKHNSSKDGYRYQCILCHHTYGKDVSKRAEWSRRSYLKRKATIPEEFMWRQARHRAFWDYSDMEFSIEISDVVIPDVCPYMGVPFIPLDRYYGHSLDRIDSSKGYTKDNVQVISRIANIMKNNATKEQLLAFAEGVLRVHQGGQLP